MPPLLPAKPFKSYDQLLALLQVRGMLIENEARAKRKLAASKDDCIIWHREQSKEIPIWVAIETWDFGLLTKYYNMLKWHHKNSIAGRVDASIADELGNWLHSMNILRNKCAHHARIWNMRLPNPLPLPNLPYFSSVSASREAPHKLYGLITILWFLMKKIGPNSDWLSRVRAELATFPELPNCTLRAMGFPAGENRHSVLLP